MKRNILYIVSLLALLVFLYWLNKRQPVEHVWVQTYNTKDKEPYGAYVFDKLLKSSWGNTYTHSYENISRLKANGDLEGKNLLIITETFSTTDDDVENLFEYIREGGTALIAMRHNNSSLSRVLHFDVGYDYFSDISANPVEKPKDRELRFCTPGLEEKRYYVPAVLGSGLFTFPKIDSIKEPVFVIATNSIDNKERVIMFRYEIGKGSLLLSCNPLLYTNYAILNDSVNMFVWNSLSYLQGKPLLRTEYYHAGSNFMENSQSPLRYLRNNPPLKWALNVTIVVILLFMFFTARRKQKAIPVIKAPQNKMLDFVHSITGLYIQKNNNADIIIKKKIYWADTIKRNYGIDIINETHNPTFFERLASKTNKSPEEIADLFRYLDKIDEKTFVPDSVMMNIITKINTIR